jgi:pimeloyl-ACP methyl ester carboxylesterase
VAAVSIRGGGGRVALGHLAIERTVVRRRTAWVGAAIAALLLAACTATSTTPPVSNSPSSSVGPATPSTAASPTAPPTAALSKYYGQQLRWTDCGAPFQCSELVVPLDYSQPSGATISLAVIRLRTASPATRLGSLVLNPGGPGGSGVAYARGAEAVVDDPVRARYDIVGFDPRGVGASAPVHCLSGQQIDLYTTTDGTPTTPAAVAQQVAVSKMFAAGCATKSPKLYGHVGTPNSARDVDILRAVLGDKTLNWLGASYGTFLGATYAELFPTRVGRMVLDGAIDPTLTNNQLALGQAKSFDLALRRFVASCDKQRDCPLPTTSIQAGIARIQTLFLSLQKKPLSTGGGRPLTSALAMNAVLSYLYFPPDDWDQLRHGLTDALSGAGATLLSMLDSRQGRQANGQYDDNSTDALYAVNALDRPDRPGVVETEASATAWAKVAPVFGAFLAWGQLPYAYWTAPATDTEHRITAPGSPPILVVGTTYDPATPYAWARSLAKQLSKGVLLTRIGDGHTAYGMGSACIDKAIDTFLVSGTPPLPGTVCRTG